MKGKTVIIIGAGPGGLATAMLLAHKGYKVTIYEKEQNIGGRSASFDLNGYTFDIGPTFLMLPQFLEELFTLVGKDVNNYVEILPLDPLYRVIFPDGTKFHPSTNTDKTIAEIERLFPGEGENYRRFKRAEGYRYKKIEHCFKVPYNRLYEMARPSFIEALPYMDVFNTLNTRLKKYFKNDKLLNAMSFQTKYIGMSPWQSPSAYSLISYIEHQWGIHHVRGGLNQICFAMAKVAEELGVTVKTASPVSRIISKNKKAVGVLLEKGEEVYGDKIVINADFAHAMSTLIDEKDIKKYTHKNLANKDYSCSTFMLYLGVNKKYDIPHHSLIIGDDFKAHMDEVSMTKDPSVTSLFYVHNPAATDATLAPDSSKSPIYVLVPVPNLKSKVNWDEIKVEFRNKTLQAVKEKAGLYDITEHIEEEKVLTPNDWQKTFSVYNGAVFNLSHALNQMFYFRPHNKFEKLDDCYLVGGGTHPGSGLPTIILSALISSELIVKKDTGKMGWEKERINL